MYRCINYNGSICQQVYVYPNNLAFFSRENEEYPLNFVGKYIPVLLCFATMINKIYIKQILTLDSPPHHFFLHSQLYITLLREISISIIRITIMTEQPKWMKGTYTINTCLYLIKFKLVNKKITRRFSIILTLTNK